MHWTDPRIAFAIAIVFGLSLPSIASRLEPLIIPMLIAMMAISLAKVSTRHAHKHHERRTVAGLVMANYLGASAIYLLLTFLFVPPNYQPALFIFALAPPAIGIIPLARIFKGDLDVGFLAEVIGYLAALIIVPVGTLILFGSAAPPGKVFEVVALIIIVPFVLSRIVRRLPIADTITSDNVTKPVISLAYAVTFAAVIGLNRASILDPLLISVILVLLVVKIFLTLSSWLSTVHRTPRSISVLYMLFGSMKNGGIAIAITILLFGPASSVALAVNAITLPMHLLLMERLAA
jgi:predicted Na+-dependent transporter